MSNLFSFTDPAGWLASSLFLLGLKSVVVLGLAGIAVILLRGASAATRHLIWLSAMAGVLLLPVLGANLPALPIPGFLSWGVPAEVPAMAPAENEPCPSVSGFSAEPPAGILLPPLRAAGTASPKQTPASECAPTVALAQTDVPAAAAPTGGGSPWPLALSLAWLAGTLGVGLRLALCHRAARRLVRQARRFPGEDVHNQARGVAGELGLFRKPRVLMGKPNSMPMVIGWIRPALLLPPQAAAWTEQARRNVLLHEMAHVRRGDVAAQYLAQIACAMYWWNPLVWWGAGRLRHERELAADDCVLTQGVEPADYASQLLAAARGLRMASLSPVAGTPFAPHSHLRRRLHAVLADRARNNPGFTVSVSLWLTATLVVAGVAALTPGPGPGPGGGEQITEARADSPWKALKRAVRGERRGTRIEDNDGNLSINSWTDDGDLELKLNGELEINDAETDIVALSPGGKLTIVFDDGDVERALTVTSNRDGVLERRWMVNGRERPYDDEARDWLAEIIPEIYRHTGYQAKERVQRLHRRGGVGAVLEEIDELKSDYVRRHYYGALLNVADADRHADVLERAAGDIDSDYELAELLVHRVRRGGLSEEAVYRVAQAADHLDSDYERGRVLKTLLREAEVSPRAMSAALAAADQFDSDYELAEFLLAALRKGTLPAGSEPAFFDAAATIDSDYELRRVLDNLVRKHRLSQENLVRLLELAENGIDSNYEMAELLVKVARTQSLEGDAQDAFRHAMDAIDSRHERSRVDDAYRRHTGR